MPTSVLAPLFSGITLNKECSCLTCTHTKLQLSTVSPAVLYQDKCFSFWVWNDNPEIRVIFQSLYWPTDRRTLFNSFYLCVRRVTTSRLDIGHSCLHQLATTHLWLSTWPTMNSLSMPYLQHRHCLATNWYRQQTVRKESIWQYATSEQKVPIIDASCTSIFHLQSYTGKHMLQQHYPNGSVVYDLQNATRSTTPINACSLLTKDATFYLYRINNIPICHHCIQ